MIYTGGDLTIHAEMYHCYLIARNMIQHTFNIGEL